ncbi:MAG: DNA polymerase I [Acidimicrobiia bacterium]|nr:DNA polymerase I [Acidimicrobiia bacterium]
MLYPRAVPAPALFLIDGSSQMYRAYHAFRGRGLTNQEGHATHAVYVFVTMLRKLVADHEPAYLAASFDLRGPTFRDAIAADYKANRAAMPDDLVEQIEWVHEACQAMGVPILTAQGYEADDVIGTVTAKATTAGLDVAIVSIDKDFFQLVRPGVRVFDPREDGTWYDEAGVAAKFGVAPEQVVDVLALLGDTSDNVAGVPGVGRTGAIDLITAHGSLDALLAQADSIPQKKYRDALLANREQALRSRELVTIRTDVAIDVDLDSLRYRGPDRERCHDLFTRLDFRGLLPHYAPPPATAESIETDYALICTTEALDALVAQMEAAGSVAMRVIADDDAPVRSRLLGFAFSTAARQARYVPVGHDGAAASGGLLDTADRPEQLDAAAVLARVRPLLEGAQVRKTGHDLKFDTVLLARHGVTLGGLQFDTMLASYLLDATRSGHDLAVTASEHLSYQARSLDDVRGRGAKAEPLSRLDPEAVRSYACERADLAGQLSGVLGPRLAEAGLEPVFRDLELPLVPVLADIERAGVRIDAALLAGHSRHLESELASLTARIYEMAGGEFNVNSPKQLGEILFEKLQLPALKKTGKTKSASTAVEVLEELALTHELPRLVLDWRGLQKLKSTYVDALPLLVNPETGRLHTSFNQAVAATGRLSSSDPNLQNIPIRTELGREIRRAFIADPDHVLISADYSQIELRVLAHLSGDETLIEAFRSGADIHDRTAATIFGGDSGIDPHELRRRAKMVNYALLYGKTAFTLARDISVTKEAAQAFIDAYFAGFPRVRAYIDRTLEDARRTGVVTTLAGRRRLVPNLTSRNFQVRAQAERETVNMPIQGTAADILKRAMIDLHHALRARAMKTRMILTVHDELLFESPRAEADEAAAVVRQRMEGAATLAVPLTVAVGIGENWKTAKP